MTHPGLGKFGDSNADSPASDWCLSGLPLRPLCPRWLWDKHREMRIHESVRKSVVFLGIRDSGGAFAPYGTGFITAFREREHIVSVLITAKHVLNAMRATRQPLVARVNTIDGRAAVGTLEGPWFEHPSDKYCDITLAFFSGSNATFDFRAIDLDRAVVSKELAEKYDIGCGDEVSTMGLLVRHFGEDRNIPVVRTGNIAAMPDEPINLDEYGFQRVYLVESRSIGGLSGSPVFFNMSPVRILNGASQLMTNVEMHYLLGVNVGLLETSAHADRAPSETLRQRELFLETMSSGIAMVVPVERILEIINGEEMMAYRKTLAAPNGGTKFKPNSAFSAQIDPMEVSIVSELDNPSHKEDFMSLLDAAAKTQKSGD
jgi:hypothetical protein